MTVAVGTKLGPYEVLAPLGAGGMGEVYRARDTRLGRLVAVKILPDSLSQDPHRVARFETEARVLAVLSHPNILGIHDFGQSDGRIYAVTELLDGETLRDRMAGEPMAWRKAAEIAAAMADGLASAHAAGIVHRDLKPENVFITSDGRVKVLDFGLAKVVEPVTEDAVTATSPSGGAVSVDGEVVGTLSYMAPEQLRGLKVDGRTDIFALGSVLYEMLSGKRPFTGATPADTLSAILHGEPPSLEGLVREIPPALGRIVSRCLEKRPEDRFDTAHDLALSLRSISTDQQPVSRSGERLRPVRLPWLKQVVAAAAALVIVLVLALWHGWHARSLPSAKVLAILPTTDLTGRPDGRILCDGLSASLRVKLQRVPSLEVVNPSSPAVARETDPAAWSRDTGANILIQPLLRQNGQRMQVSFSVTRPGSSVLLAADEVTGPAAEPFRLEEELASRLLSALEAGPVPKGPKSEEIAAGPPQVDFVLAAGYLDRWDDAGSIAKAVDLLTTIPNAEGSALVQAALGKAYLRSYELSAVTAQAFLARQAAERAIALDSDLPEALVTLGRVLTATGKAAEAEVPIRKALQMRSGWADAETALGRALSDAGDKAGAEAAFTRATQLRPNSWAAFNSLASFYFMTDRYADACAAYGKAASLNPEAPTVQYNLGATLFRLGKLPEAADAFRRSIAIRPTAVAWSNLGTVLYANASYDKAVEAFAQAVRLAPDDSSLWMNLGDGLRRVPAWAGEATAAYEKSIALARAALSVNPRSAQTHASLAVALARTGKPAAAQEEARKSVDLSPSDPNVLLLAALVATLDGTSAQALSFLEKGLAAGLTPNEIETEPDLTPLTRDPRYKAIIDKHNKKNKEGSP